MEGIIMFSIHPPAVSPIRESPVFPSQEELTTIFNRFSSTDISEQSKIINEFEKKFQYFLDKISVFEHHINVHRDNIYEYGDDSESYADVLNSINRLVLILNKDIAQTFETRSKFYQALKNCNVHPCTVLMLNMTLSRYELKSVKIEVYKNEDQSQKKKNRPFLYDEFARSVLGQRYLNFFLKNQQSQNEELTQEFQNEELTQEFLRRNEQNKIELIVSYETLAQESLKEIKSLFIHANERLKQLDGSADIGCKRSFTPYDIQMIDQCILDQINLSKIKDYQLVSQFFETRLRDYNSLKTASQSKKFSEATAYLNLNYFLSTLNLKLAQVRKREFAQEVLDMYKEYQTNKPLEPQPAGVVPLVVTSPQIESVSAGVSRARSNSSKECCLLM